MAALSLSRGRSLLTVAVGALALSGAALADSHPNLAAIPIPDSPGGGQVGSAPVSQIVVSGEPLVAKVTVTLFGFAHSEPDDVDALLVGPAGQKVVLMSDAGADNAVGSIDLVFDDDGTDTLSDEGVLAPGRFPPSNYGQTTTIGHCEGEPATDVFPGAPAGPISPSLGAAFNGSDPNGTWSLYLVDDCGSFTGAVQGGWSVDVNPAISAVGVARFTARPNRGRVLLGWRTANEAQLVGFNVYRAGAGRTVKVNGRLVVARHAGSPRGGSYRIADTHARTGRSYTYRLQVVRLDGSRVWASASAIRAR
jgi:hypothetical protein